MFFYILLISLTAIYQGILNYHSVFIPSAFSPVLLNIANIDLVNTGTKNPGNILRKTSPTVLSLKVNLPQSL